METAHRRIDLQSPHDLLYLQHNASTLAQQKLDLHLPPSAALQNDAATGEDAMRKRVEELVEMYLRNTWQGVKMSLCVNGLEGKEMEKAIETAGEEGVEEIEPYDHRLAQRIQSTSAQIESLTLDLANLRRSAPSDAATRFSTQFAAETAVWETKHREAEDAVMTDASKEMDLEVGDGVMQRSEEMRRTWERGVGELGRTREGIGATVAKVGRARDVIDYLEGAS